MPKFIMNVEIEAEQFLPDIDQIPAGVSFDGPRNPKNDPRATWYLKNSSGIVGINATDYVVTMPGGDRYLMAADIFEKTYKPIGK